MSRKIKVMYDREADVLAIIFNENSKNRNFIEPIPGWIIWFDENNDIRMIEIFRANKLLSKLKNIELSDFSEIFYFS